MNISNLNWALPNSSQSNALKFINLKEILESFNHIIDICDYDENIGSNPDKEAMQLLKYSNTEIFIIHEALINQARKRNKAECHKILDQLFILLDNQTEKENVCLSLFGNTFNSEIEFYFNEIMNIAHRESYENKYRNNKLFIRKPTLTSFEKTVITCEYTLNKINENIPELYDEINSMIDKIVIIESNGVNAGSYLNTLGTFIIREFNSEHEHWTRMLEHIVHESAHNLLYHLWYQEPLITDDEGLYYTPFRLDNRPLSGIYHAMFVLARTIFAFDQHLQNGVIRKTDIKSHYNEANNSTPFKEKFFQTVSVIESSKKTTEFGHQLLSDCVQIVDDCESTI